jgi:hypothetical protein
MEAVKIVWSYMADESSTWETEGDRGKRLRSCVYTYLLDAGLILLLLVAAGLHGSQLYTI